ncbi:MAG: DUF4259 domain-containing protein [Chloroflexota bacterium]
MGTWGPEVFDSDDAGEFYDEMVEKLVYQIVYLLADEALTGTLPGNGDGLVVAAADILAVWGERLFYIHIEPEVAKHWRTLSLQYFDRDVTTAEVQSPENVQLRAERRAMIESTFDRLIAVC